MRKLKKTLEIFKEPYVAPVVVTAITTATTLRSTARLASAGAPGILIRGNLLGVLLTPWTALAIAAIRKKPTLKSYAETGFLAGLVILGVEAALDFALGSTFMRTVVVDRQATVVLAFALLTLSQHV